MDRILESRLLGLLDTVEGSQGVPQLARTGRIMVLAWNLATVASPPNDHYQRPYVGRCESNVAPVAVAPGVPMSLSSRKVGEPGPLVSEDPSHRRNPAGSRCVNHLLA